MNIIRLTVLALRNLFRNNRRTLITLLVASAGFAALAIFAGYMDFSFSGLREVTISKGFAAGGGTGHIQVYNKDAVDNDEEYAMQYGIEGYKSMLDEITQLNHVSFATARIEFNGLVSNGDKSISFMGIGVDPVHESGLIQYWNSLRKVDHRKKAMSDAAYRQLQETGPYGVLLGRKMGESLNVRPGDTLMLMSTTVDGAVNVVDVDVAGLVDGSMSVVDSHYLVTTVEAAERLLLTDKVSKVVVVLDNTENTTSMAGVIDATVNTDRNNSEFAVVTWDKLAEYYYSVRDIYNIIFGFTGGIVVVIVFLACVNTMLMSTMERVREIGTLKAIGVSNVWISLMFLFEGLFIGLLSIVGGLVLQYVSIVLINNAGIMMPPPPGTNTPYQLRIYPAFEYVPWIGSLIVMSTTMSGFLTLLKIRKISIVNSLTHV